MEAEKIRKEADKIWYLRRRISLRGMLHPYVVYRMRYRNAFPVDVGMGRYNREAL